MARYSATVRSKRKKQSSSFLPETIQAFIARRMVDGVALALALVGFALVLAIASYNHTDPSWNTARDSAEGGIHNLMGLPGSYMADVMVQTIGLGGLVFAVVLMAWGVRIWRRSPLEPFWARVASMLFAGICAAIAFARIPAGDWLLTPWMGGSGGVMMLNGVANVIHPVMPGPVHAIVAVAAGIMAFAALLHACAVNRDELTGFIGLVWRSVASACTFAAGRVVALFAWISHYNDPDYRPVSTGLKKPARTRRAPALVAEEDDAEDDSEEENSDEEEGGRG
jgi:S-DNA-T family DNA segregation ATPase FtsK/SpoIIIE